MVTPCSAGVIFFDDFSEEQSDNDTVHATPGHAQGYYDGAVTDFTAFDNWTVTAGYVDLLEHTPGYSVCASVADYCIELAGSTDPGATCLTSRLQTITDFVFNVGTSYTVELSMFGNQYSSTVRDVEVSLGGANGFVVDTFDGHGGNSLQT